MSTSQDHQPVAAHNVYYVTQRLDRRFRTRPTERFSTYGFNASQLAELTGVHLDTARRWKRAGSVPGAFSQLLELRLRADLGVLDLSWAGWVLTDGWLYTPARERFLPSHILALPYRWEELRAQRALIRGLRR